MSDVDATDSLAWSCSLHVGLDKVETLSRLKDDSVFETRGEGVEGGHHVADKSLYLNTAQLMTNKTI